MTDIIKSLQEGDNLLYNLQHIFRKQLQVDEITLMDDFNGKIDNELKRRIKKRFNGKTINEN